MITIFLKLVGAVTLLVGLSTQSPVKASSTPPEISESPALAASRSDNSHGALRPGKVNYRASNGQRAKDLIPPGEYIPRHLLSVRERQVADQDFVQFLKDNNAHHDTLQDATVHAAETFAIREKVPSSHLKTAYPKQLRRHYQAFHGADKAFLKQFRLTYNALQSHQFYLEHPQIQIARVKASKQKRRSKYQAEENKQRAVQAQEAETSSAEENKGETSNAKQVIRKGKGLEWDLNLDEGQNEARHGHAVWSSSNEDARLEPNSNA